MHTLLEKYLRIFPQFREEILLAALVELEEAIAVAAIFIYSHLVLMQQAN